MGPSFAAVGDLQSAIDDVHELLNLTAGTAALVVSTLTTPALMVFGAWFGDVVPTIHLGIPQ